MRFAGVRVIGSRFQPRQVSLVSGRFSPLTPKRLRLDTPIYASNEVSTTDSQSDSELEEVFTLTPKTSTSSDIKTLRRARRRQPLASTSSPDSTSRTSVTEQIFSPGAEDYLDQKQRPLKINRDLLMYRAKGYRWRGIKSRLPEGRSYWFKRAERNYQTVMRMDPTDPRPYVGLGRLYELWKRLPDARKVYENGCAVAAGKNPHIWTSWGNLEKKARNLDTARDYFKAAITADKAHQVAWHSWGMLEKSIGDFQAAKDCWMKGIKYAEGITTPYFYQSLALLSSELEMYDAAREWFKRGTEQVAGRRSYALWHEWGVLEAKLGNYERMEELFKKTLKINNKSRYTYLTWGKIEQEAGRFERAKQLFCDGHERSPQDPALLHALAMLESENGNLEQARLYFRQSLEIDPSYQLSWQAWGVLEFRFGNPVKSRKLFQRGIWADPKSKLAACVFHAWGRLEDDFGNTDLARICYKYGIKVDSKHEVLWQTWIAMEQRLGNVLRANELRSYSMEQRRQIALPKDFDMLTEDTSLLEDFFTKFSDWVGRRGKRREV